MDEREKRQRRMEFDVDEVYALDLPPRYLRLTGAIRGFWRRELALVLAVLAVGTLLGFVLGRVST